MTDARRITVKVDADPGPYSRGLKKAERDTRSFGQKVKGSFGKLSGGALAGLGAVTGALFGLGEAVKSAAEDADQADQLAAALKRVAGASDATVASLEDWIFTTSLATGVADSDLRPALQRLATVTGDTDEAQRLLTTAMDIAAATGKPLQSVAVALGKAYKGQNGPLEKLTGLTLDAGGNAATWATNQDTLNKKFGGAAQKKADTYSGTVDRLNVAFGEIVEELGTNLLPLLEDFVDFLSTPEGKQALQDWTKAAAAFGDFLKIAGDALGKIGAAWSSLPGPLRDFLVKGPAAWAAGQSWSVNAPEWWPWSADPGATVLGATTYAAGRTGAAPASAMGPTIVVQAAVDPQQTARAVQRLVRTADVRGGRKRFL